MGTTIECNGYFKILHANLSRTNLMTDTPLPPLNMCLTYLVQERFLNNGIISVNADGTKVENGHRAAGHIEGIVQLRENCLFIGILYIFSA